MTCSRVAARALLAMLLCGGIVLGFTLIQFRFMRGQEAEKT